MDNCPVPDLYCPEILSDLEVEPYYTEHAKCDKSHKAQVHYYNSNCESQNVPESEPALSETWAEGTHTSSWGTGQNPPAESALDILERLSSELYGTCCNTESSQESHSQLSEDVETSTGCVAEMMTCDTYPPAPNLTDIIGATLIGMTFELQELDGSSHISIFDNILEDGTITPMLAAENNRRDMENMLVPEIKSEASYSTSDLVPVPENDVGHGEDGKLLKEDTHGERHGSRILLSTSQSDNKNWTDVPEFSSNGQSVRSDSKSGMISSSSTVNGNVLFPSTQVLGGESVNGSVSTFGNAGRDDEASLVPSIENVTEAGRNKENDKRNVPDSENIERGTTEDLLPSFENNKFTFLQGNISNAQIVPNLQTLLLSHKDVSDVDQSGGNCTDVQFNESSYLPVNYDPQVVPLWDLEE